MPTMKNTLILFLLFFQANLNAQQCTNDSTGLIPITDLGTNLFNGKQGGLYGNGLNNMPYNHMLSGIQLASEV